MLTTERLIQEAVNKFGPDAFKAQPKFRYVSGPGFAGNMAIDSEELFVLPNGQRVNVHTDASGTVTHVEEDDALHAIVRPDTYRTKMRLRR